MKRSASILLAAIVLFGSMLFLFVGCPYYPVRRPSIWPIQYPTANFSVDDVRDICGYLQDGEKNSIFDEPLLARLKQWHERYGIVASLYVQGPFLVNSQYADEIKDNSDWLRWGYHGVGKQERKKGIGAFTRQFRDSIGTTEGLDKAVRVDYYHADLLTLHYRWYGYKIFYTADDWRFNAENRSTNYYLSASQCDEMESADILYDAIHDITFIKTDLRVEFLGEKYGVLESVDSHTMDSPDLLIIFTHERVLEAKSQTIDSLFGWLCDNGYQFGFPYR